MICANLQIRPSAPTAPGKKTTRYLQYRGLVLTYLEVVKIAPSLRKGRHTGLDGWRGPHKRQTRPEGPERHLDTARQKLPRDNFCRSLAAQLPSPARAVLKEEKLHFLVGERQFGRHFKRQFGRGRLRVKHFFKIAARKWGVNSCREAFRCLAGPSGRTERFLQADHLISITQLGKPPSGIFKSPDWQRQRRTNLNFLRPKSREIPRWENARGPGSLGGPGWWYSHAS